MVPIVFDSVFGAVLNEAYWVFDIPTDGARPSGADSSASAAEKFEKDLIEADKKTIALLKAMGERSQNPNAASTPRSGRRLVVVGLSGRPEYNGCRGVVVGPADSGGRWIVTLEDPRFQGVRVSLKPASMQLEEEDKGTITDEFIDAVIAHLDPLVDHFRQHLLMTNPHVKKPSKSLRRALVKILATHAGVHAMSAYFYKNRHYADKPDESWPLRLTTIQTNAEVLAYFARGWRHSPDALVVRGLMQMLRGNFTEAVQLLSVAEKSSKWVSDFNQEILLALVGKNIRRGQEPRVGRWRCLFGRPDLLTSGDTSGVASKPKFAPSGACGASVCQVGETMYLFGGLKHGRNAERSAMRIFLSALQLDKSDPSTRVVNSLLALDLTTMEWRRVECSGEGGKSSPPGRAFASFTHSDGCLWLFGGRKQWSEWVSDPLTDMWKFDLAAGRWSQVAGRHPSIFTAGPCAMVDGVLFVVDACLRKEAGADESLKAVLRRFDTRTNTWSVPTPKAAKTAPLIKGQAVGWEQDGSMYVWSINKKRENWGTSIVYEVKLGGKDWGSWIQHRMLGPPLDTVGSLTTAASRARRRLLRLIPCHARHTFTVDGISTCTIRRE